MSAIIETALRAFCGLTLLLTAIIVLRFVVITTIAALVLPPRRRLRIRDPERAFSDGERPRVLVIVPAHNEAAVIEACLDRLQAIDYPRELLDIVVVNDRSTDGTGDIVDAFIARTPGAALRAEHRASDAVPGKSAAISEVCSKSDADIFVFFDADYLPTPELVTRLTAPFADPRVAATMGRVVPINTDANVLTRLLDLERRGGYAIDLEMRERLGLHPQFGGTTGAVRRADLDAVGGWRPGHLAEDTDLTYRFFLADRRVVYLNDAECYEEVPEDWRVRYKQVRRWSYGHNQCMLEYIWPVITKSGVSFVRRADAALVLLFYLYPALALLFLPASLVLAGAFGLSFGALTASLAVFFLGLGNLSPFFTIFVATLKDGQPEALRYLPLLFVSATISMVASAHGFLQLLSDRATGKRAQWDKTARFRRA